MKVKSESEAAQSCPTLQDPMDCSLPGSSVHGIFQQEYWSGCHCLLWRWGPGLLLTAGRHCGPEAAALALRLHSVPTDGLQSWMPAAWALQAVGHLYTELYLG